jgi:hypothetical protein
MYDRRTEEYMDRKVAAQYRKGGQENIPVGKGKIPDQNRL